MDARDHNDALHGHAGGRINGSEAVNGPVHCLITFYKDAHKVRTLRAAARKPGFEFTGLAHYAPSMPQYGTTGPAVL